jgi:hypothetical protein
MANERATVFSGGQLHQFPADGLTDAADLLKEFYSMYILHCFSLHHETLNATMATEKGYSVLWWSAASVPRRRPD